ncbi:MAG: hypothetical protein KKD69_07500 [Euryarchaeota archaeon]|nr:hypothetical protein [Euryarchaeota archaeon]
MTNENKKYPREWEEISKEEGENLHAERLRVHGGWLVKSFGSYLSNSMVSQSMCFVPDPGGDWKLEEEKES